jgi:hypothetical protein
MKNVDNIDEMDKLHPALLFYTNLRKGIIQDLATVEEFRELPVEDILKVREALYGQPKLIDSFVKENPFKFLREELEIVRSRKDVIKDDFYIFRLKGK